MINASLDKYTSTCLERLRDVLKDDLVALYLVGSFAQHDPASNSDIDLLGIVSGPMTDEQKQKLVTMLDHASLAVPVSGLDLLVINQNVAASPTDNPEHQLWFSTGETWPTEIDKSGHANEHLIALEMCRESGEAIYGAPAHDVIGTVSRRHLVSALRDILRWHAANILDPFHDFMGQNSVLNACRAWQYLEEGKLSSKSAGANWVLNREPDNTLVVSALSIRRGNSTIPLERDQIEEFLSRVIQLCDEQASTDNR